VIQISAVNFTFVVELVTLGHFSQARYFAFSLARNDSTILYIISHSLTLTVHMYGLQRVAQKSLVSADILNFEYQIIFFSTLYMFTSQPLDTFYELTYSKSD